MKTPTFSVNAAQLDGLQANAINIELWGFKDNRLVKPMAVARALQLLPAHQLEGLKKITYEEKVTIKGLRGWVRLPGKSAHKGRYNQRDHTITIHLCSSRAQFFHTLFHELGHFVYFRILTSFEKKRWVQSVYKKEPAVTRYGQRNAAEDFAEGFALYVTAPHKLVAVSGKVGFLRDVVFRGAGVNTGAMSAIILARLDDDRDYELNQIV
jgi:hypothetical protein